MNQILKLLISFAKSRQSVNFRRKITLKFLKQIIAFNFLKKFHIGVARKFACISLRFFFYKSGKSNIDS